jgi:uncharacterized membrane protein YgcG
MKLTTLAGAAAAAALTVALGAPMANAADARTTGSSTPAFASDCYRTHFWDGRMHPYSRIFCDYDPGFDQDYYVHHPEFRYHGDRDHSGVRDHDSDHTDAQNHTDARDTGRGDVNHPASPAERGATDRGTTDRGTSDRGTSGTSGSGAADRGSAGSGAADRGSAGSGGSSSGGSSSGGAGNMPGGR